MIAACPRCGSRYRIAREQIRPEGVRVRCQRCQAAFRVRAPSGAVERRASAAAAGAVTPADRARLVVLAHPDPEHAKAIAASLGEAGLEVVIAHDGVEAILTIQRVLPRAVILEASLPRMYGFQICELMKRNESLRGIGVLLVGSVHRPERYRRPPGELYGADGYLEGPDVAQAALEHLGRMGLPVVRPAPRQAPLEPVPAPAAEPARPAATPDAAAALRRPLEPSPAPAPSPEPRGEAVAKAERLARIIVSDIVLYNEEKFRAALESGNVIEALEAELEEGRALFRERVEAPVRELRDFLSDELLRVARTRGMK